MIVAKKTTRTLRLYGGNSARIRLRGISSAQVPVSNLCCWSGKTSPKTGEELYRWKNRNDPLDANVADFSGFFSEVGFKVRGVGLFAFVLFAGGVPFHPFAGASNVSPPCLVSRGRMRHITGVFMPTPEIIAWPLVRAGSSASIAGRHLRPIGRRFADRSGSRYA